MWYRAIILAMLVALCTAGASRGEGKWTNYTSGNDLLALAVQGKYIWAATTVGVVRWDTETETYMRYTTADGLVSNYVLSIAVDKQGTLWFGVSGGGVSKFEEQVPTFVYDSQSPNHPETFGIRAAHPNPFNVSTTVDFDLNSQGKARLVVYSVGGQLVETLIDSFMNAGSHRVVWNASRYSSGVYLVVLESEGLRDARKVVFMK